MQEVDLKKIEQVGAVQLTRKEKLLHWAGLVRQQPRRMQIFHLLEKWSSSTLACPVAHQAVGPNAFAVAFGDPVFQAAGLKAEGGSVQDAMNFFELTQDQLHEFSCNCGGEISNQDMADRITNLANGHGSGFRAAVTRIISHYGPT